MIPIRTDYRMTRTPWVNYGLVAVNVLMFLSQEYGGLRGVKVRPLLLDPNNPQLHQFFTSVFLHGGWDHLLGNMVFLWVFGNALNDRFGHMGYLGFYLAGGVLAGVGYLLFSANAPVLGASGAISAVAGAYLVLLPRIRVTLLVFLLYFITYFEVSSLIFLLFQFIWNLYMSLMIARRTGGASGGGGVAYVAHSAGYLFGIGMAMALLALRVLPRDVFDLLNMIRNARRRGRYRRMVARGYDPFNPVGGAKKIQTPASPPPPSTPPPPPPPAPAAPPVPSRQPVQAEIVEPEEPETDASRELQLRREISEACTRHDLTTATARYLELVQITEQAVLARQQQLDVANQLMSTEQHAAAADAYERFIRHYGGYQYIADIRLMLGLLYCRYLQQYERAEQMLSQAVSQLKDTKKIELAESELRKIRDKGSS